MTTSRIAIGFAAIMLIGSTPPASSQQIDSAAGSALYEKAQSDFADAFNRKDSSTMASLFSEDGVRITPPGIFRGRDAIGHEFKRLVDELGLHDYKRRMTVSRLKGNMVFNAGEWSAKLGNEQPYRGYFSTLMVREGDGVKIFEETVTLTVP